LKLLFLFHIRYGMISVSDVNFYLCKRTDSQVHLVFYMFITYERVTHPLFTGSNIKEKGGSTLQNADYLVIIVLSGYFYPE